MLGDWICYNCGEEFVEPHVPSCIGLGVCPNCGSSEIFDFDGNFGEDV